MKEKVNKKKTKLRETLDSWGSVVERVCVGRRDAEKEREKV